MSLPFSQITSEPTLADLLKQFRKQIFLDLNCHHIGTVKSFDSENRTVTVQINYSQAFYRKDTDGNYKQQLVSYPLALDLPIVILSGGEGRITFPISEGDQCLVLFNDRDISNWFNGATSGQTATPRLHSFSDGIAIIGLFPLQKDFTYDEDRVLIQNDAASVGVGPSLIRIENATRNLNTLLQDLVNAIKAITTSGGQSVSGASQAALSSVATEIAELLE